MNITIFNLQQELHIFPTSIFLIIDISLPLLEIDSSNCSPGVSNPPFQYFAKQIGSKAVSQAYPRYLLAKTFNINIVGETTV